MKADHGGCFGMQDSGMNTGASEDATVKSFEDAVAKGLKVDGLTPPELISVIDRLLCLLVAWLQGNSLVQTLFTCLYLHNVDAVPDPILKPVCIAFLKVFIDPNLHLFRRLPVATTESKVAVTTAPHHSLNPCPCFTPSHSRCTRLSSTSASL